MDAAQALWACVRLQLHPGPRLLHQIWQATQAQLRPAGCQPTAAMLWAAVRLGVRPPNAWMAAAVATVAADVAALEPAAACQVLWALARLDYRPHSEAMSALVARVGADAPRLQPRGWACLAWALGRLAYRPPPAWWAAASAHLVAALPACGEREVCNILWGLGRLRAGQLLSGEQVAALGAAAVGAAEAATPRQLAVMLSGCAALAWRPSERQSQQLLRRARPLLAAAAADGSSGAAGSEAAGRSAAVVVVALAGLGASAPSASWQADLLAALPHLQPRLAPQQQVGLLTAAMRLGARPSGSWVAAAVQPLAPGAGALPPAVLQQLGQCLAAWQRPLPEQQLQALMMAAVAAAQRGTAMEPAPWEALVGISLPPPGAAVAEGGPDIQATAHDAPSWAAAEASASAGWQSAAEGGQLAPVGAHGLLGTCEPAALVPPSLPLPSFNARRALSWLVRRQSLAGIAALLP